MRHLHFYIFFFCLILLAFGCDGKDEIIPSYVHIPSATVDVTSTQYGSKSSKITHVWLFANDQQIGVFELPVTVPILDEGDVKITMQAGIKADGLSYNLQRYPFYDFFTVYENFTATEVDTVLPVFTYIDSTRVMMNNDFEDNNNFEVKFEEYASFTRTNNGADVFEGSYAGCVNLVANDDPNVNSNLQLGTIASFDLIPTVKTYVELDYRNSVDFDFYVAGLDGDGTPFFNVILTILESEDWNKIYINLTPIAQFAAGGSGVEFGFLNVLPESMETGQVCFDNIKLIRSLEIN